MERFWDLRRTRKKAWYGAWALIAVAGVAAAQWQSSGGNPILTQVLGAQAKKPDVTPPAVSITFPANNGVYGPNKWTGVVRGSASDATDVNKVEVRLGDGPWIAASGTTSWSSPLSLPAAEGLYAVWARAIDTAPVPNISNPVAATFRVDRTAPAAAPTFTRTPDEVTFETKAQFNYQHAEAAGYECALDGDPATCGPQGLEFKNLQPGVHTFVVVVVDAAGNRSPAATWSWTILIEKVVAMSGDPIGPLSPGATVPLNLKVSNPYNFTIQLYSVDVTVTASSTNGCRVDDNFDQPTRRRFTLTTPALVPAHSDRHLMELRPTEMQSDPTAWPANWPTVAMRNTSVNQDACKGATFTLSYSGTATKP